MEYADIEQQRRHRGCQKAQMATANRSTLPTQVALFEEPVRAASETREARIERAFEIPFVAELALKEKQIQQSVRPVISVHKWFARRPGTLFRALLLSEFARPPLAGAYFKPHQLRGVRIADPFMGGGTPLLEANRLGCDVFGWDVNAMAYWVVRQEIEHLDLIGYEAAARRIGRELTSDLGVLYQTKCGLCANDASVKYFIWVKVVQCESCESEVLLLPGYVVARSGRHPRHVLLCRTCGDLTEVERLEAPGDCASCGEALVLDGTASRGRCTCGRCGRAQAYSRPSAGPPKHRMVAIEYHCEVCKNGHKGRFFKMPDATDSERYASTEKSLQRTKLRIVPEDLIPDGDETSRLHRWGYQRYREMFNARQLLSLERLGRLVQAVDERRIRNAIATNFSDLLRYQNMLCRYDARALKSLDVFSVHGFPVGLVQCEYNFLGIQRPGTYTNVGSGGWSNIVEKFLKGKRYCDEPFETSYEGRRKRIVAMPGEWIGERRNGDADGRVVALHAGSATKASLPENSLDAVLTDPPYFANVQYAELMDFCYVWLRKLLEDEPSFRPSSTRSVDELTGNQTLKRDLEHFTKGLAEVYCRMAHALKPGSPFVFTYHHNAVEAYYPIAVALLDAGLVCTAALPCPAEMGGSIHIHGTGSSIIDTVFVCRSTGVVPRVDLAPDAPAVASIVRRDLDSLQEGGVMVTAGDARCVTYGHLIRLAVWRLKGRWDVRVKTADKLDLVRREAEAAGSWEAVRDCLADETLRTSRQGSVIREEGLVYGGVADDEVAF